MRLFLAFVITLVAAVFPVTVATRDLATPLAKYSPKSFSALFQEEVAVNLRTETISDEEIILSQNNIKHPGYFQMMTFNSNDCSDDSLQYETSYRLNTCIPFSMDEYEHSFVLYGSIKNGFIYGRRIGFADEQCKQRLGGLPKKMNVLRGQCSGGMKYDIADAWDGSNQNRGYIETLYTKLNACTSTIWGNMVAFFAIPFGTCLAAYPEDFKFTACDANGYTKTLYSSSDGTCSGSSSDEPFTKSICQQVGDNLWLSQPCF